MTEVDAGGHSPRDLATAVAAELADVTYVWRLRPNPGFEYLSESVAEHLGHSADDFLDRPSLILDLLGGGRTAVAQAIRQAPPGRTFTVEIELPDGTGGTLHSRHRCRTLQRPDGSRVLVGAAQNTTAEVMAWLELAESERLYRELAEHSADFAMQTTPDRTIVFVSNSVTEVLGWQPADLVGHPTYQFIHPDDLVRAAEYSRRVNAGESVYLRTRFRTVDGDYRWMAQHVRPIRHQPDRVTARAGVWRDVTAEVAALDALQASEEKFRRAMQSAPTGIAIVGPGREFLAVNPALGRLLGRSEDWLMRHGMADVLHPDDNQADIAQRNGLRSDGQQTRSMELRFMHADGQIVWLDQAMALLPELAGRPASYITHFVDVTEARAARERLTFLAHHDDLTGQLRPAALLAELSRLLAEPGPADTSIVVLYIDVDALKSVNDTLGHDAGDQVIRDVAQRIAGSVRVSDVVARIGGDEFVVVLPRVRSVADAERVAGKIHAACAQPLVAAGQTIRVSVSIGLSTAQAGDSPDDALHRADMALYRSKRGGRDRTSVYSADVDQQSWRRTVSPATSDR